MTTRINFPKPLKYFTRFSKGLKQMPGVEKGKSRAEFRLAGRGTKAAKAGGKSSKGPVLTQSRGKMHGLSPVSFEESFSSCHICITS